MFVWSLVLWAKVMKYPQYLKLKAWIAIVLQCVGRCLIDFTPPHHKPHVQHPKIPNGILDPTIAKDVQLGMS
jgi:hypothetical protein